MPGLEERAALIERNLAELLGRDELLPLLQSGEQLRHYIGFEISGRVHIGQGLLTIAKVRDFIDAGVECRIFLADWHTWINDKLGGDRERIRKVATGYFAETFRAAMLCLDGDPSQLRFVLASDLYREDPDYWATVVEVAKHTTLARMQRSVSIMGRSEGEQMDFAKLLYPAMQAADIFALKANIAHAGMDQRKAHVIARDVALQLRIEPLRDKNGGIIKPLAAHHPLLLGMKKPPQWPVPADKLRDVFSTMKMSKSDPASAVFLHDSADEIKTKVQKMFAPPGETELNPLLDWIEKLCFGLGDSEFHVARTPENGGAVTFHDISEVREAYGAQKLHPMDAKAALAERLIARLEPARKYFEEPGRAAMAAELERN